MLLKFCNFLDSLNTFTMEQILSSLNTFTMEQILSSLKLLLYKRYDSPFENTVKSHYVKIIHITIK